MSPRVARWLAGIVWIASVALAVLGIVMYIAHPSDLTNGIISIVFLVFSTVGAVVAASRPENPIGWIFLTIGFSNLMWTPAFEYAISVSEMQNPGAGSIALVGWVTMLADSIGTLGWELITIAILLFPNGRLLSPRWKPLVWFAILLIALETLSSMLNPGQRTYLPATVNPIGIDSLAGVISVWQDYIAMPLYIATLALCAVSLLLRFLHASGEERQQIKWVAYATVLVVISLLLNAANVILGFPVPNWITLGIFLATYAWLPISVGIAILKFRLYNIDVIINRTLVYGVLTGMLLALYVGIVVLLQSILSPLTGQGSDFAIAVSTLAIAALFLPLRKLVQGFIDRRFYRRKYNAAVTLETFSATLRDEVDLEKLASRLTEVVNDTMQPSHVSVWLMNKEQGQV